MSFARTMTVKNTPEEYVKVIINELVKLSANDTRSNDQYYHCNDEIIRCLYKLVTDVRKRGEDVISSFPIILNGNTDEKRKSSFYAVVESLFEDCIRWPRVIVAFMYILEVLKISEEYDKYYNWSVELVLTKIYPWVKENGGWEYIILLSINRNCLEEVADKLRRIAIVALGITALFALLKWMFNRC